jgi:hypothetical protein
VKHIRFLCFELRVGQRASLAERGEPFHVGEHPRHRRSGAARVLIP